MPQTLSINKRLGQMHIDLGSSLKYEAECVLKKMGLSVSDAVRIFLRQVVLLNEIPFNVRFSANIPNEETRAAMAQVEAGEVIKITPTELKKLWDDA